MPRPVYIRLARNSELWMMFIEDAHQSVCFRIFASRTSNVSATSFEQEKSVAVCLCLSACLCLSVFVHVCLSVSVSVCLSLFLSLSESVSRSRSVFPYLRLSSGVCVAIFHRGWGSLRSAFQAKKAFEDLFQGIVLIVA